MTTIQTWPDDVTQDVVAGSWQESPETNNVITFPVEVGTPMMRRRASVGSRLVSFKIFLSAAAWESLINWYEKCLLDGTLPFERINARSGNTEIFTFQDGAPPTATDQSGPYFVATCSARKEP